jgi:hypothetical protein
MAAAGSQGDLHFRAKQESKRPGVAAGAINRSEAFDDYSVSPPVEARYITTLVNTAVSSRPR